MIAGVTLLAAPAVPPRPELLAELETQLLRLAALSDDSYQFVVGQALDTAAALLHAHERRAAS